MRKGKTIKKKEVRGERKKGRAMAEFERRSRGGRSKKELQY